MSTIRFLASVGLFVTIIAVVIRSASAFAVSWLIKNDQFRPRQFAFFLKILLIVQWWLISSAIVIAAYLSAVYHSTPAFTPVAINLSIGFAILGALLIEAYWRSKDKAVENNDESDEESNGLAELSVSVLNFQPYLLWGGLGYYLICSFKPQLAYNFVTVACWKFSQWIIEIPIIGAVIAVCTFLLTLPLIWTGLATAFVLLSQFVRMRNK